MSSYQALSLMLQFGLYTLSLISLIVLITKDKKKRK
ncbi:MAG: putative holin-like toxin [Candidatus Woesearchaeota archaeon]